jgi:hypothetical protein
MKPIAALVSIVALLLSGAVAAQTFKCTNAAGKVTYSNTRCAELGLKDAGEVKDRLNINSPPPPTKAPARQSDVRVAPPARPRAPEPAPQPPAMDTPAADADAKPERRCFVVHTAQGNVVRCNDRPDEQKPDE